MIQNKKELAVAALCNGTVIDHIPSESLFKVVDLLRIREESNNVTIGFNLDSSQLGKKGIIKIANVEYPEQVLNRIAIIAPSAVVNIIRNYEVVEKHHVSLPDTLINVVRCPNPKCISNNEPMASKFHVVNKSPLTLRCHYCECHAHQDELQLK